MKVLRSLLLTCTILVLTGLAAPAAVPPIISYQGRLTGADGKPVADGTYTVRFAIYDVPTGGTPLWSETNSAVQTKGGLFSVLLGSVVNLPANIFDSPDRFFGVQVGSDAEMTPRQQIASVPFAMYAAKADTAAQAENADAATQAATAAVATTVADGAITTSKIADGAVTESKIAGGYLYGGSEVLPPRDQLAKTIQVGGQTVTSVWDYFYTASFSGWVTVQADGAIEHFGDGVYLNSGPGISTIGVKDWSLIGQQTAEAPARFLARWRTQSTAPGFTALIRVGNEMLVDPDGTGKGADGDATYAGCGFKQVGPVLYAYLDAGDGTGQKLQKIADISGQWQRFLGEVERDGDTLKYYLNGALLYQTAIPNTANGNPNTFSFGRITLSAKNNGAEGALDVSWVMRMGWGY